MYHYQLDPPASQQQEGDEFDDCVTWVRSAQPIRHYLEEIAHRTNSVFTKMDDHPHKDDGGFDFTIPGNTLDEIEAFLSTPRCQGIEPMKQADPMTYAYAAMGFQAGCRDISNRGVDIVDTTDKFGGEMDMVQYLMDQMPYIEGHFCERTDNGVKFDGIFVDHVCEPIGRQFLINAHIHGLLPTSEQLLAAVDEIIDARLMPPADKPFSIPELNMWFDEAQYLLISRMIEVAAGLFGDGDGGELGYNVEYERGQVELIAYCLGVPTECHGELRDAIYAVAKEGSQ